MKLHFEADLDYQQHAVDAVCDVFRGQEACRTEFTVTMRMPQDGARDDGASQLSLGVADSDLGLGNRLMLLNDQVLANVQAVQLRNGLPRISTELERYDFTVEMETGTGKTYVYLRSIFELNKRYGFSKFVIVVPSVAIKEGVYHSIETMASHFGELYSKAPFEYFIYDSAKLGQVRNFATSSQIQIMVVTVGAINKKEVNNIYGKGANEATGGERPIDLLCATRPIIIVDEPQSVDGGLEGRGRQALDAMNPLCTLRYSATHANQHHMLYRLNAVAAYEKKLVKQIEVASATIDGAFNKPYVKLLAVSNKRGLIGALVELDVESATGAVRKALTVYSGDDLQQTTGRALYENYRVGELNASKAQAFLELRYPAGEVFLSVGQAHGDVDEHAVQREMIRRTIKEHLDKEIRLRPLGVKVLSLFFIDSVAKYRSYDADGLAVKGEYALAFEAEYQRAAKLPAYQSLFKEVDLSQAAADVHNGYFSIDKKGVMLDTAENNAGNRDNAERAYNLIMKDKEKLLSFETPLKFIFSHSALREGWDNPNVFQICNLREMAGERERRQTIGRGLRLCVNQEGLRLRGFEVNTLTVIAKEDYEIFAKKLQKEMEDESGVRFGVLEAQQFTGLLMTQATAAGATALDASAANEQSKALWEHLAKAGMIDAKGKVQDALRTALKTNALVLPPEFEPQRAAISELLRQVAGRLEVKNADSRATIATRQAVLHSPEFKALWDRIKYKTTYRVQFDNAKLIADCVLALQSAPPVPRPQLRWNKAGLEIDLAGVMATEKAGATSTMIDEQDIELPDVLTDLQDRTQLTRRSIATILTQSGRLNDFKRNPQSFIATAGELINRTKRLALVEGIKYQRLGDGEYYAQALFEQEELTGYLQNVRLNTVKSIYEHVVYDSATERDFADELENNEAIKVYAKLPGWFKVPTPLGSYNPDWAVLVEQDGAQQLYFVVETKSSLFEDDLRSKESANIFCGAAHFASFAAQESPAQFVKARTLGDVMAHTISDNES